jgi:histidinol-phosphate aminotransferase
MNFTLENILRENIKRLTPYSSARSEFKGEAEIFLDANENSFGSPLNKNYHRYPDPLQLAVKTKIAQIKNTSVENIFLGNGSDEAIDILFRSFCIPQKDNAIICPPTYGMYEVSANINDVEILSVPLIADSFAINVEAVLQAVNSNTKLIFICNPNNPTANLNTLGDIKKILTSFNGIVVIDEAYIDFANCHSLISELKNYPNLVILQTFSKAWGLAGLRLGMAFADSKIIAIFNKVKPPYNVNIASQELLLEALDNHSQIDEFIKKTILEREKLITEISKLKFVVKIYPSQTNFILVKTTDANALYQYLVSQKIIVRNRDNIALCLGCLRITIGTEAENKKLIKALNDYLFFTDQKNITSYKNASEMFKNWETY